MTWALVFFGVAVMGFTGFGVGRHVASVHPKSRAPQASQKWPTWHEKHARLRNHVGLAHRNQQIQAERRAVHKQFLQFHLSPHFMFNALSSVQWMWADGRHQEARELFRSFVALWRRHWHDSDSTEHRLAEELEALQEYVQLESFRRDKTVAWSVRLDPQVNRDGMLPIFLFQPAVENAFCHGFGQAPGRDARIEMRIRLMKKAPGKMWVEALVLDNGTGLPSPTGQHVPRATSSVGMSLTRDRLIQLDPGATVEVAPAPAPWSTQTRYSFPINVPKTPNAASEEKARPTVDLESLP